MFRLYGRPSRKSEANLLKWDMRFLDMAKLVSTWSRDPSTKTGAVITDDKSIVSVGFNGFPSSMPDKEEWYNDRSEKYSRIVHCEVNSLVFANRSVKGCTLYTFPFLSCDRCFSQMVQAGIIRFVAPKANEDQLSRWGEAFKRVRRYAQECGVEILELDYK